MKTPHRTLDDPRLKRCGHEYGYRCACYLVEEPHEPDVVDFMRRPHFVGSFQPEEE